MKTKLLLVLLVVLFGGATGPLTAQTHKRHSDGKTLRVKIGTLSGVDRGLGEMFFNPRIETVTIVAHANSGTLQISFTMRSSGTLADALTAHMLIRLFDRNGAYLTHVVSEPLQEVFSYEHLKVSGGIYVVTYTLPIRDLRDASIAEFGFFQ